MLLAVDAELSCPPSELTSFRELTMFAYMYEYEDVVAVAPRGMRSLYWAWMKNNGIRDYIKEILLPAEVAKLKAISLHGDTSMRWTELGIGVNKLRIKALHSDTLTVVLEYVRFVNED